MAVTVRDGAIDFVECLIVARGAVANCRTGTCAWLWRNAILSSANAHPVLEQVITLIIFPFATEARYL